MSAPVKPPYKTGRPDMQSYDGGTGEPFTNIYHATLTDGVHLGQPLPLVIGRTEGANNKANAEFLVRAANVHDELVEVLKTTAGNIRSIGPAGALYEPYTAWLAGVEAAIAKAEGRQ